MATVYLMSPRKGWHHHLPGGWIETHWERFDYVECGIFEKPDRDLNDADREFMKGRTEEPEGFIWPSAKPGYGDLQPEPALETVPQQKKRHLLERRDLCAAALFRTNGNVSEAARLIALDRGALQRELRKWGWKSQDFRNRR